MREEEAVARAKRGDIAGLEALVRAHQLRAVRTAYLIVGDRSVAEDIAQQAFLRAYQRIDQFHASRPFAPWFLRIVANDALKAVERGRRTVHDASDKAAGVAALADLLADPAAGPAERLEEAECRGRLARRPAAPRRAARRRGAPLLRRLSTAEVAGRVGTRRRQFAGVSRRAQAARGVAPGVGLAGGWRRGGAGARERAQRRRWAMNDVRRALAEAAARDVPAGSVDLWPAIRAAVAPRVPEPQDRAPRSWQGRLRGVAEVVWVAALCVGIALAVRAMVGTEGAPAPSPTAALPAGASHGTPEATPEAAPTALPPHRSARSHARARRTYEARPTERHQGRLRFLLSANPRTRADRHRVTDLVTGEALGAWSVPDVNVTHYHNVEYHDGRLYVLKRLGYDGYPDEDWTDELWRYDRDGQGDLLYRLQGLDFRVSPDERWIAVRDHERALVILDGQGQVTAERDVLELAGDRMARDFYRTLDPSPFYRPAGWSADGEHLWLEFHPGVQLIGFLRLSAGDWHVEHYDVSGLGAGFESALEPTTGRLAYSDMPAILDEFSHEEFVASRRPVTLYVLDLETGQSDVVAVSEARRFLPRWLDEETLDYYDPADTSDDPARITTVVPEVTAEGRAILYIRDDDLWRASRQLLSKPTPPGRASPSRAGRDWLQIYPPAHRSRRTGVGSPTPPPNLPGTSSRRRVRCSRARRRHPR